MGNDNLFPGSAILILIICLLSYDSFFSDPYPDPKFLPDPDPDIIYIFN